jgi:hypothetical protein
LQGPLGDRVGDGAGEMEGCEGVQALDVAALADAGYPGAVSGEMPGVYFFDRLCADLFLGGPHATGGLEARDGSIEARAGDPEARRHVPGPFVLYDARQTERAAGGDAEGSGGTSELAGDGPVVGSREWGVGSGSFPRLATHYSLLTLHLG